MDNFAVALQYVRLTLSVIDQWNSLPCYLKTRYSGITFAAQAEESIALVSVEAPSQPFSGWVVVSLKSHEQKKEAIGPTYIYMATSLKETDINEHNYTGVAEQVRQTWWLQDRPKFAV